MLFAVDTPSSFRAVCHGVEDAPSHRCELSCVMLITPIKQGGAVEGLAHEVG